MEYIELEEKIIKTLENRDYVVLATASKEGIVSASEMYMINIGKKIYFQTDSRYEKVKNIKENPNVAINMGNIYFKGRARILGKASDYPEYVTTIKQKNYKTYENYTNLPNQILIEVDLTECRIWGFEC